MSGSLRLISLICVLAVLAFASIACGASSGDAGPPNVLDDAAAQATAIVGQAQATAMVLQAQAQATVVMAAADVAGQNPTQAPTLVMQVPSNNQSAGDPTPTPESKPGPAQSSAQTVEVLRVSFAAEGGMIQVQFRAPPDEAAKWWQGSVSVTDEANGTIYNEIPVMPKIGPLIGMPKRQGQLGYVMLSNTPPYLQPGAVVTIKMGNYTFEHVPVQ